MVTRPINRGINLLKKRPGLAASTPGSTVAADLRATNTPPRWSAAALCWLPDESLSRPAQTEENRPPCPNGFRRLTPPGMHLVSTTAAVLALGTWLPTAGSQPCLMQRRRGQLDRTRMQQTSPGTQHRALTHMGRAEEGGNHQSHHIQLVIPTCGAVLLRKQLCRQRSRELSLQYLQQQLQQHAARIYQYSNTRCTRGTDRQC